MLFEAALGIDADIWIGLQNDYDKQKAKSDQLFAERLARIRKLAAKIGTKKSYISRIENGKAGVQLSTLYKIFQGLGKRVSLTIL